jgi:hypothetical protein
MPPRIVDALTTDLAPGLFPPGLARRYGIPDAAGLAEGDGEAVAFGKTARARYRTTLSPTNVSRLKATAIVIFSLGK